TKNIDLKKLINIPSVSTDEEVLSIYLLEKYKSVFDKSYIDNAGNIVFEKGNGSNTVLLLGHIDTVPYYWTPKNTENNIFARGSVDAKSSYFN
ncbi:acetyl-lysine deacetylase, partial [Staphylococcus aureus]|nr:acetyl-lysine deacetylase [Staphylococcus aureus]